MIIEEPHGYLRDSDGRVVLRFSDWSTGEHPVPKEVESVEYIDDPNGHTEQIADKYKSDPLDT